jgi:hypothetical protein
MSLRVPAAWKPRIISRSDVDAELIVKEYGRILCPFQDA